MPALRKGVQELSSCIKIILDNESSFYEDMTQVLPNFLWLTQILNNFHFPETQKKDTGEKLLI